MFELFRRRMRNLFSSSTRARKRQSLMSSRPAEALEDRLLLTANLNLLGSGLLIYGGSGVDNDVDISQTGTEYTFSDPSEPINAIGGLAGFDTDPDPNIVTFDTAAVGFPAFTQIVVNNNAGDDTTTVSTDIDRGLDVRNTAIDGSDTLNLDGNIGAMGAGVSSTVLLRGETINMGGGIWTDNTNISVVDDATLTGAVALNSGTGTVQFDGTIDGAFDFVVGDSGSTRLNGDVGSGTPLDGMAIFSAGRIHLAGAVTSTFDIFLSTPTDIQVFSDLTAIDGITFDTPVTRFINSAAVSVESTGSFVDVVGEINSTTVEDIHFESPDFVHLGGPTSNPGAVSITAPDVVLDGVIGALAVDIMATSSVSSSGGFQASVGDVIVDTPTLLFGPGGNLVQAGPAGVIDISGDIDGGGGNLLIRRGTSVTVGGSVASVDRFDVQHGFGGIFDDVTIGGSVDAGEIIMESDHSTINLGGDLTSASDITLNGSVNYTGGAATFTITSGGALGDAIVIRGAVEAGAAGQSLVLNAGAGDFQNLGTAPNVGIGQTTAFENVTITGGIIIANAITVTSGDIIFEGGALRLRGALSTTTLDTADVIFRPRLPGGTLEVHNRAVPPPSPNMTVSGLELGLIAPGFDRVIFGGPTAGAVTLLSHHSTGPFATPDANMTIFEAPLITISDHIDQGLGTDMDNEVHFVGDIINFNRSLRGPGDVHVSNFGGPGGLVTVNGAMSFPFGLPVAPMDVFFDTAGSDLLVTGNFGHHVDNLTVAADNASFPAVTALDVSGDVNITAGNTSVNGGVFSVTGSVTITGDLELTGNVTLKIPAGESFTVTGNIIGNGNNLVIRGAGGPIASVDVGGDIIGVGRLNIDSSGAATAVSVDLQSVEATHIIIRAAALSLEGTIEATVGSIDLFGPVTLTGDTSLVASGALTTRAVRVNGAIDGGGNALAVDTARVTLGGSVTGVTDLTVVSSGFNYVTAPITVSGTVDWNNSGTRLFILQNITACFTVFDVPPQWLGGSMWILCP